MTSRTWNGSDGASSNAADWLPVGVPVSGDVATINSGTVTATGTVTLQSGIVPFAVTFKENRIHVVKNLRKVADELFKPAFAVGDEAVERRSKASFDRNRRRRRERSARAVRDARDGS